MKMSTPSVKSRGTQIDIENVKRALSRAMKKRLKEIQAEMNQSQRGSEERNQNLAIIQLAIQKRLLDLDTMLGQLASMGLEAVYTKQNVKIRRQDGDIADLGGPFLVGRTPPVTLKASYKYDLGKYLILIPLENRRYDNIHLIPMRKMNTHTRHPHHTWRGGSYSSTCFGGFQRWVIQSLFAMDLNGLMRHMIKFANTIAPGDQLTSISQMDHARIIRD